MNEKKIAVVMSSSFFGFVAHAGFLKGVSDSGINPVSYGGTSAGALIAALAATGMDSNKIKNALFSLKKEDFWDPDYWHLLTSLLRFMRGWKGLLNGDKFKKLVGDIISIDDIKSLPYDCCIVGTDLTGKDKWIFKDGSLVDAVYASGAVPMLFKPLEKDGRIFVDGGLVIKAPILDLYYMSKPDVIIVHYIRSADINKGGNYFMKRFMPPYSFSSLSHVICRHEEYLLECELVRNMGCDVVEISPELPRLSPNKLNEVGGVYQKAYEYTKNKLSKLSI